jgi:hypothetical protein
MEFNAAPVCISHNYEIYRQWAFRQPSCMRLQVKLQVTESCSKLPPPSVLFARQKYLKLKIKIHTNGVFTE